MPRLTRNFLLNLVGFGLPLAFALVAVPLLTQQAGLARFGFLSLAWAVVGYIGFLDLGLPRVFARRVALARRQGDHALVAETSALRRASALALAVTSVVSLLGAVLLTLLPLQADGIPEHELRAAWWVLIAALPALVVTNLQRGAMEGMEAFGAVNALRVVFGTWMFAGPLLVLLYTPSLPWLVGSLTAGRWLALALHWFWCRRYLPAGSATVDGASSLGSAVREGLWITVSNVVGPLMVVFDRFVLAAVVGLAAVSAYAIAQEVALRLLLVPAALSIALFPRLAAAAHTGADAVRLSAVSLRWATAMMLLICSAVAAAASALLPLWLGPVLAAETLDLLLVLLVGVAVNAAAQIVFALLQATGRARQAATLHLVELPLYIVALLLAVWEWGATGAAIVWVLRVTVDAAAMVLLVPQAQAALLDGRAKIGVAATAVAVALLGTALASTSVQVAAIAYVTAALIAALALAMLVRGSEVSKLKFW